MLTSIMSSKNLMPNFTDFSKSSQSISHSPFLFLTRWRFRSTEFRLHDSYGKRGTSPHGFVASNTPKLGVGLSSCNRSKNAKPGSPVAHACSAIKSKISRAFTVRQVSPLRGLMRSQSLFACTASINLFDTPTEILKFFTVPSWSFKVIKSTMSGWSAFKIAMFAPWRLAPCKICDNAAEKAFKKSTGPDEDFGTFLTLSPCGRIFEKLKPVPPLFL